MDLLKKNSILPLFQGDWGDMHKILFSLRLGFPRGTDLLIRLTECGPSWLNKDFQPSLPLEYYILNNGGKGRRIIFVPAVEEAISGHYPVD